MKKIVVLLLSLVLIISCAGLVCTAEGEHAYARVTSLTPIAGGFKIHFTACEGAARYKLFYKTDSDWKKLGTTAETSFDCARLQDKTAYTFTVRGQDETGAYLSTDYDKEGFTQVYYTAPKLRALKSTVAGLFLRWDAIETIDYYAVYVKNADQWSLLTVTDQTTYTATGLKSGKNYTYTVAGVTQEGTPLTYYDESGLSAAFVAAPKIKSMQNLADGTQITWGKCAGASAYRVFLKTASGWKKLGVSSSCTYTHKKLKNNTTYTYTVRAMNKVGKYVSDYRTDGSENTFFSVPKLTGAAPAFKGMKISWNRVTGVNKYLVFVKNGSGWKQRAVCSSNTYVDASVSSGKAYTYTVKCADDEGNPISYYNKKGVSSTFVAAPTITDLTVLKDSIQINIKKSAGAYSYRYFEKTADGWKAITTSKALSAVRKSAKNNALYTFTVRAVGKNGKYVSASNPDGVSVRFFAPPAITEVTLGETQNELHWQSNALVPVYRVYKKVYGGSWSILADTDQNTMTDTAVQKGELYTYTLRYLNEAKKALSYYASDTKYYYNGAVANGKIIYGGKTLNFTDGVILHGLIKRDGKSYFYNSTGFLQKNGIVGDKSGYYYADKNGVIDFTYRDAVKQGNKQWLVLDGKAKKVSTEYDKTLYRAFLMLRECTKKSMTKEEKLYASFRYLQKITLERNPRIPHYTGKNWHLIYANDIFLNRSGNCMSYGAAFAFMAKAIGYKEVYCCNSGGHGWAEVNHLVYDPEWDIHHKKSFYGISYDVNLGNNYKGAIAAGYWWMRVKI